MSHTLTEPERVRRFWERAVFTPNGCIEWQGQRHCVTGYGMVYVGGGRDNPITVYAHRRSYELANGPIPDGLHVMHSCDNPPCVNPAHLSVGTPRDNCDDKVSRGRQARGENHNFAKLHDGDVLEIRRRAASGDRTRSLAASFGVSKGTITRIVAGATWRHLLLAESVSS